jgi:hypothetical protein
VPLDDVPLEEPDPLEPPPLELDPLEEPLVDPLEPPFPLRVPSGAELHPHARMAA